MKKRILTMIAAAAMTMAMSVTSFAAIGQWRQDSVGWWWEREGGSYLTNQWMWIDGNADGIVECYCFGPDGYMLANTTTPDGYTVDANGAWTVNGVVQSRGVLPEIVEREDHPYFIAGQFHPEFGSRPLRPHPLFDGLVKAALKRKEEN